MNETMSLVLATAILAIGGVGFYMYKQSDDNNDADYYNDDDDNSISNDDDNSHDYSSSDDSELEEDDFIDYEPKASKQKAKTKRNKTSGGTRKKRY